jgi:Fur family transcriptional regulator, peroxide stress response regulator
MDVLRNRLMEKGLKVTPQRLAILGAVTALNTHPTADEIMAAIKTTNPNISLATVYKVLDAFVEKGLIKTVKTDRDIKRYDAVMESHHHLYHTNSSRIEDYTDNELNEMLRKYFDKKGIPNFKIEDIKLQIIGRPIN